MFDPFGIQRHTSNVSPSVSSLIKGHIAPIFPRLLVGMALYAVKGSVKLGYEF